MFGTIEARLFRGKLLAVTVETNYVRVPHGSLVYRYTPEREYTYVYRTTGGTL